MRTLFLLSAVMLFAGCSHETDVAHRTKIPATSLSGMYIATYTMFVDGEEVFSSPEGFLELTSYKKPNYFTGIYFQAYYYDQQSYKHGIMPEPGDLRRIVSDNSFNILVEGQPYDGYFEDSFSGNVVFYGGNEATMYMSHKPSSDIDIHIKGWMKERQYHYDPANDSVSYNCEITMEFTIEEAKYTIVIKDAANVYYN